MVIWILVGIMGVGTFFIVREMGKKRAQYMSDNAKLMKAREEAIARGEDPDAPRPPEPIEVVQRPGFEFKERSIIALDGPLKGTVFPITGGHHIGRDLARCHILFPKETFGVSGDHCVASLSEDCIKLKDNGSTFGTYFSNGAKLITDKSYTMKPGSEFYLGRPVNRFRVL